MKWGLIGGVGIIAVLVGMFAVAPLFGAAQPGAFSAYDDQWAGLTDARDSINTAGFETRSLSVSPVLLTDLPPDATAIVIAGMDRPYGRSEEVALGDFMERGGTVFLFDDFGYGQDLAALHGIDYLARPLVDREFERNQSFVRVAGMVGDSSFQVLLNGPTALKDVEEGSDVEVFMRSSNASYLNLNPGDGDAIGVEDKLGPFNVGLTAPVGSGRLVVISDSGFLINDMFDRAQNQEFLMALVAQYVPEGGYVIFDESRRDATAFEVGILGMERGIATLLRNLPITGLAFSVGVFGILVMLTFRMPGTPSWVHRFAPGRSVAPPSQASRRDLLHEVAAIARDMHGDRADIPPAVRSALHDPDAVRDADLEHVLEAIAASLAIELPAIEPEDEVQAPPGKGPRSPEKVANNPEIQPTT